MRGIGRIGRPPKEKMTPQYVLTMVAGIVDDTSGFMSTLEKLSQGQTSGNMNTARVLVLSKINDLRNKNAHPAIIQFAREFLDTIDNPGRFKSIAYESAFETANSKTNLDATFAYYKWEAGARMQEIASSQVSQAMQAAQVAQIAQAVQAAQAAQVHRQSAAVVPEQQSGSRKRGRGQGEEDEVPQGSVSSSSSASVSAAPVPVQTVKAESVQPVVERVEADLSEDITYAQRATPTVALMWQDPAILLQPIAEDARSISPVFMTLPAVPAYKNAAGMDIGSITPVQNDENSQVAAAAAQQAGVANFSADLQDQPHTYALEAIDMSSLPPKVDRVAPIAVRGVLPPVAGRDGVALVPYSDDTPQFSFSTDIHRAYSSFVLSAQAAMQVQKPTGEFRELAGNSFEERLRAQTQRQNTDKGQITR